MEQLEFINNFNKQTNNFNKEELISIINQSINSNSDDKNFKGYNNLIIVMEELSELSQAIAKELRGKGNSVNTLEETADVCISLYYIKEIFNISDDDLYKAIKVKMDRVKENLDRNGIYK